MTTKPPATGESDKAGLYGGIVLGLSAIAALIVANSPLGPHYEALLRTTGEVRIGSIGLSKTVDHWINDGLMAVFFLLVGLEIKREVSRASCRALRRWPAGDRRGGRHGRAGADLCRGQLERARRFGLGHPGRHRHRLLARRAGLLGTRAGCAQDVPAALAIVDDLGAIVIIAIFYTGDLSSLALALAALGIAVLAVLNLPACADRRPICSAGCYLGVGAEIGRACHAGRRRRRLSRCR